MVYFLMTDKELAKTCKNLCPWLHDVETQTEPYKEDEEEDEPFEDIKPLSAKLEDLHTCNDLVGKHGSALQRSIGELQEIEDNQTLINKLKAVNEKATLFRITSNAMISACAEFLDLAQAQEKKWHKSLEYERHQRINLEETVEVLARQHNFLERACQRRGGGPPGEPPDEVVANDSDEDENEFFDAISEHSVSDLSVRGSQESIQSSTSSESYGKEVEAKPLLPKEMENKVEGKKNEKLKENTVTTLATVFPQSGTFAAISSYPSFDKESVKKRRTSIQPRPDISINLWSILKNCIGKELTKIPMPVNFNEPLSMLQRLTEDMEYSEVLDRAAACHSSLEQMCYVAAFTVSSYSTTSHRTGKPFNPLLGETFECDRSLEKGWRSLAEQVSHHPPASALHVEHKDWIFWQEFTATSKFRGKYLQIIPQGVAHLKFTKSGNHYTWRKVTTTVHNIIVGRLWVDQSGEMDIVNHTTNENCHLRYDAYNYFGRDTPRKVTGVVTDASKVVRYVISGTWDHKIDCAKVVYHKPSGGKGAVPPSSQKGQPQTLPPSTIWTRVLPPPEHDQMYFMTEFAITLNEEEDGVAPTDSRNRPDQRLMENGKWEEANQEKLRIEDKQRAWRRRREQESADALNEGIVLESYKPVWFEQIVDELTETPMHVYKGGYWEAKEKEDFSCSPDIY
ncbi:oxysterol-binding protein 1-like isoform X3 [Actinia tenebrosa]|uniref:Oxysterol-binding protein n=1 Tax=Actinia tenebrosa TaxID=6105 RepID=A0A6P8J2P5_ACTTE|nr:oxysterol-binding protein 1-like isoform X3 [Actinia tenebrosa]